MGEGSGDRSSLFDWGLDPEPSELSFGDSLGGGSGVCGNIPGGREVVQSLGFSPALDDIAMKDPDMLTGGVPRAPGNL